MFSSSTPAKVLSERTQVTTPLPKKAIKASPAISRSVRKALGDVNRTVGVTNKKEQMRQENQPYTAKKVSTTAFPPRVDGREGKGVGLTYIDTRHATTL